MPLSAIASVGCVLANLADTCRSAQQLRRRRPAYAGFPTERVLAPGEQTPRWLRSRSRFAAALLLPRRPDRASRSVGGVPASEIVPTSKSRPRRRETAGRRHPTAGALAQGPPESREIRGPNPSYREPQLARSRV